MPLSAAFPSFLLPTINPVTREFLSWFKMMYGLILLFSLLSSVVSGSCNNI